MEVNSVTHYCHICDRETIHFVEVHDKITFFRCSVCQNLITMGIKL